MILSLLATVYILAGGLFAALLVRRDDRWHPFAKPFRPAPAFALVFGVVALWPVLLLLAVAQRSQS